MNRNGDELVFDRFDEEGMRENLLTKIDAGPAARHLLEEQEERLPLGSPLVFGGTEIAQPVDLAEFLGSRSAGFRRASSVNLGRDEEEGGQ